MSASGPTIRVLLTEDNVADAELNLRELKRAGLRVTPRIADSEPDYVSALRDFSPDVILSDFSMPHFDGMEALALAREICPDVPFVFVSGTIGEEYAIRALKNGATDYVLKTNLARLPAAVERALEEARARTERRKVEAELHVARERIAGIMNSLPDMFWSVELPSERTVYVSPTGVDVFGRSASDFLGDPNLWSDVVHSEDRPQVLEAWRALVVHGTRYDVEYRANRPDGGMRWVNDRGHLVRNAAGMPVRIDGVVRDITQQVAHRQRIARLSRIREFSSSINSALVRLRDRDALFQEICRVAVEVGGFKGAHVGLLDAQTKDVRWAARHGAVMPSVEMPVSARADVEAGQGIVGEALRSGKAALWNDVARDAGVRNRDQFLAHGVHALGTFPLMVEGEPYGIYSLHAAEPGFFDQEEIALLEELASNVSFALELIAKQDRIAYLALYDTLTGLPNRTLFHERLAQAIQGARHAGLPLGLVLIDLERFKAINDTLGSESGDRVLQAVAQRLRDTVVDINQLARLGSNLFALLFLDIAAAEDVARRMEAATPRFLGEPFLVGVHEVRLAAKTGIGIYPDDGIDADTLFRNAEAALRRAKETGERIVFYAPEINARVSEQVQLEHRLRKAVEGGELYFHYQPKVDLASRRIVGLEALMRWKGPDGQLVPPTKFVPVLEQTGLILEAGHQAISAATGVYRTWQQAGLEPPRIAVNVSALQLRRKSFVEDVRKALGDPGNDGGGVDLEITESLLMTDVDESIRKLRALRDMGLRIALDDFGTGYSSLAYLSKLPLDTLKIDRGFVHDMTANADNTSIISTIISLAQGLRLKVVAEGVETEQQAQLLRLLRCDEAQGYLFSRPVSADEISPLLASR
jgi:diguanylate cyclase (GGDEF)-like protein/PAS domain S-box-containing protein